MILKNKMNVVINRDYFLLHHYHIYFEKANKEPIRAYDVDFRNFRNHVISAVGEYLEREILTNNNPLNNKFVFGVNLVDGKVEKFAVNDFLFGKRFLDSCGMASHYKSDDVLTKAYLEFFERQSLIANYLYGIPGQKIVIDNDKELERLDIYIKNYVDNTAYYNISLSSSVKVVIAITWSESRKAVGVGASFNLKDATEKAQKEILQYFAVECSAYDCEEKNEANNDIYLSRFNDFSTEEMLSNFNHLFSCKEYIKISDRDNQKLSLRELIDENYKLLKMKPFVIMFRARENLPVKVIKVFDNNWFPHMRPELFEQGTIERVGSIINRNRINYSNWIPFA